MIKDQNIQYMAEVINGNFAGFKFKPSDVSAVANMWLSEFGVVDEADFIEAVRYIRKHFTDFPQPKMIWGVLGDLKEKANMKADDSEYHALSDKEKRASELCRNVFNKWWSWLKSNKDVDNPALKGAVLYKYYDGCYNDYMSLKIHRDADFQMALSVVESRRNDYKAYATIAKGM